MSSSTLIIVEGDNDVEALKNDLKNSNDTKIISFDFKAHKLLSELNISHELMENYISDHDENMIDELSVKFTKNWYKSKNISQYLEYNNLNVGFLIENEMIPYFFNIIKRVIGIKRVYEKENPNKIISSSLNNIAQHCYKEKIDVIHRFKENKSSSLYYDNIEIPINLGGKTKSIRISRNAYTKTKKMFENFTNFFFNVKYDFKNKEKAILLLDFNPVLYSDLLANLSIKNQQFLLLNQRRPAIWNFESLKIVKNSKCKILVLEDNTKPSILEKIEIDVRKFEEKISKLWKQESILESYFSIEGKSFWKIIKNDFKSMINKRNQEIVKRCILLENFFINSKISVILEWADTAFEEKIVVHIAKKYKIPIFLLQHGTSPLNKKWEKYHYLIPYFPPDGVKSLTWGHPMKEFIVKNGFSSEEIITLGSPRHDKFFNEQQNLENDQTILIAANGFMQYNFAGNDTRSYEYLEEYIKKICHIIKKSNKKIIVKLHPGQFNYDIKPLIKKIDSSIPILQNQNIVDSIKTCDVMISLNYSTAALDAMILQKPTLTVLPEKQGYENEDMITMGATLYEPDIAKIGPLLTNLLENKKFKEQLIQKGNDFVEYYLTNQGTSSRELSTFLSDF